MLELACTHKELERLDMHKELALVIIGSAAPDGVVVDYGLKGIGLPFLQGFGRLHVVVAVHQHGLV